MTGPGWDAGYEQESGAGATATDRATRGDDPPKAPGSAARGDDPPKPPGSAARGDDPPKAPGSAARGGDPPKPPGSGSGNVRLTAWVEGRVQGVGFRWWVRSRALALGLVGEAENLADGRVKVIAEGPTGVCEEMLGLLQAGGTPGRVRRVTSRWAPASGGFSGFAER